MPAYVILGYVDRVVRIQEENSRRKRFVHRSTIGQARVGSKMEDDWKTIGRYTRKLSFKLSFKIRRPSNPRSNHVVLSSSSVLCSSTFATSSDDLQDELWPGGRNWEYRKGEWPGFRKRGNYVKANVLWSLRGETESDGLRVPQNLEGLWERFPPEIISAIYSLLHPIDLYHTIRATKGLRRFLLDKSFSFIWRECFLNYPDIPFYPDDISPPKWVSLMFGPATCDNCGVDNCLVNYSSRSRKCATCMDIYPGGDDMLLTAIQTIIGDFPKEKNDIWPLLTRVYKPDSISYANLCLAWYAYQPSHLVYIGYSIGQVKQVAEEMRKYLLDISLGTPGARDSYKAYVNATKALAKNRQQHAEACQHWAHDILELCISILVDTLPDFLEMARKVLLRRGHDPRDVAAAVSLFRPIAHNADESIFATSDPFLTKSKLPKYMQILEEAVYEARQRRLRKEQVAVCYNNITKKLLTAPEIRHIPFRCPDSFYQSGFFDDYINDPRKDIDPLDYEIAEPEIQRFIQTYMTTKRRQFIMLLEGDLLDWELELAIAVFECCGKLCVGFDEAGMHLCQNRGGYGLSMLDATDYSLVFRFSETGYQALKMIVGILSLGSESLRTLKAADLDAMNRRFVCKTCKLFHKDGLLGLLTLTWRECLHHAIEAPKKQFGQHVPVFDVLSEALTSHLLARGNTSPKHSDRVWTCCYCGRRPLTEADAIKHAFEVHDTTDPVQKKDFVFVRDALTPKRLLNFVGLDENANYRCLRCLPRTHKLWENKDRDLYRHLWDKHNIKSTDLIEGVDWERVKAVEDDGWILEALKAKNKCSK
ncbi:hypothetical protein BDN70DRAFT_971662 [Pholiota conissans]|uniref:F-box domain-containing protein n=1 Tax=Pholiota conissans TaxID=109636 RepID=A0A9P6CTM3_9AGAR|nr:hypothetical protein BDN70DRAFT_971662 [Pholiota conissans]